VVAARSALDDPRCGWRDGTEGVDVRHDVVPADLLLRGGDGELLGREVQVRLHLRERVVGDRQSELLLGAREL
jgi:hypothetical protein